MSLASSTGTSIESASKHNLQCKVSTDHLIQWVQTDSNGGESAVSILKKDKMNYTMHKNDIVVVCKGSWRDSEVNIIKAYPSVVSTYANMCQAAQYWLMRVYNNTKNMRDLRQFVHTDRLYHRIEPGADGSTKGELSFFEREQIDNMPQFAIMGVSLGLAYAHPDSGDTVGTVMYGGLKTVMNGPIKANTGQPVMWIFEFEAPLFDSTGRRVFSNRELPNVIEVGLSCLLLAHARTRARAHAPPSRARVLARRTAWPRSGERRGTSRTTWT